MNKNYKKYLPDSFILSFIVICVALVIIALIALGVKKTFISIGIGLVCIAVSIGLILLFTKILDFISDSSDFIDKKMKQYDEWRETP